MREQFAMMAQLHGQIIHDINGFFQGASTHPGSQVAPQMQAASEAAVNYQTKAKETMTPILSSFSDMFNVTNPVPNQKF